MGLDARVRYTKMVINKAFCELLSEKPFHRLTLTEVCKKAEINRTTFYKYYSDINAWKEQVEMDFLSKVKSILEESPTDDLENVLEQTLCHIRDHAEMYLLVFSPNFESQTIDEAVSLILEKTNAEIKRFLSESGAPDYHQKWYSYFVVYGCFGMIRCWLQDGMTESPKDLAEYYAFRIRKSFAKNQI